MSLDDETQQDEPEDSSDADAEAFASEWLAYKERVDSMHGWLSGLMDAKPEKPHLYFRQLFPKRSKVKE